MAASRIEQLIEDIYEFIESCRMQPLSSTKVIVPKDELYDLIDELRLRTPDEIKKYQKIILNRDAIMADAQEKAALLISNATEHTNALIDEHEVMQKAYYRADEIIEQASMEADRIVDSANNDANDIRSGAINYTDNMLYNIEKILKDSYESSKFQFDSVINSLKSNLDTVVSNRNELCPENEKSNSNQTGEEASELKEQGIDNFEFDEDTFLEDID